METFIGAPLAESDLTPMDDLAHEIRQWLLKKSLAKVVEEPSEASSPVPSDNRPRAEESEDLYDF